MAEILIISLIFFLLVIIGVLLYIAIKKYKSTNSLLSLFSSEDDNYQGLNSQAVINLKNIRKAIISASSPHLKQNCIDMQKNFSLLKQTLNNFSPNEKKLVCDPNQWTKMLWDLVSYSYTTTMCDTPTDPTTPPNCKRVEDKNSPAYQLKTTIANDINSLISQLVQKVCPGGTYSSTIANAIVDNINTLLCKGTLVADFQQKIIDVGLGTTWKLFN